MDENVDYLFVWSVLFGRIWFLLSVCLDLS